MPETNDRNPFNNIDANETPTDNEDADTPRNSGVMIHIVPETNKARWNHIEDLDSFFTRTYNYHQKHGFNIIVLEAIFQLFEFAFVIWLLTFTVHCIKHDVLFGNTLPSGNRTKVTLGDVIEPMDQCVKNFGVTTYLILLLASLFFLIRLFKTIIQVTHYWDIKKFFNTALHIDDHDLDNTTWHEIKNKIREVQAEQHMCIDKEQLTELDIYHRILRFKNYMVALMNKNLLPVRFKVPIIGEVVTLSRGLLFNIDLILFRVPGSPFQNNWQLRDDYTVRSNQVELAQRLSKLILWVALANLILAPFIFIWQLIYFSFAYASILRKEPSALGMRTWSNYGRLYLRHFNELEHELDNRLNRAYEYSDRYLSSFSSPLMTVIARNIMFISGGMLVLILALGIYDEYVLQVEHVLTIITILTVIGIVCRNLIPEEHLIWCPEQLMTAILAHVHYLPTEWKTQAHTAKVQKEFGHFFQFKANYLLNEVCSPLITPFILVFVFRPKTQEIVKFFRSFTVSVRGVGNVCSFAQMDVRKYGNPEWQTSAVPQVPHNVWARPEDDISKKPYPVENGKTELSLVRFTLTNPEWQMPAEAKNFLQGIRENALHDLVEDAKLKQQQQEQQTTKTVKANAMTESLLSFGSIGDEYSSIMASVLNAHSVPANRCNNSMQQSAMMPPPQPPVVAGGGFNEAATYQQSFEPFGAQSVGPFTTSSAIAASTTSQYMHKSMHTLDSMRKMKVSKCEGRLEGPTDALLYSIYGINPKLVKHPADVTVADMCLSTLYLHEVHKRNLAKQKHENAAATDSAPSSSHQQQQQQQQSNTVLVTAKTKANESSSSSNTIVTAKMSENTPLLGNIRS